MATVIDALLVTLGLDASGFKAGTIQAEKQQEKLHKVLTKSAKERSEIDKKASEAQAKRAKAFKEQGDQAARVFGKIRDHALGLMAVLAGGVGVFEFGKDMLTNAAGVKRFSDNLGLSMNTTQAWVASMRSVGGSAESAKNLLMGLSDSLTGLHHSNVITPQMEAIKKWGIGVTGSDNAVTQALLISKYLSALYKSHPNQARERAKEMLISEDQFNLLKHYELLRKKLGYYKANPVYTEGQAQQAERVQNALVKFRNDLTKTATNIAYQFLPVFRKMLNGFQDWANWALSHQGQITAWLDAFVAGIMKFAKWANEAAQQVGGWKVVLEGLFALFAVSKVVGIVAGITSMVGAFGALAGVLGRIAGMGTAAEVISGAAGTLGTVAKVGSVGAVGVGAMLYSQSLNGGEAMALRQGERRAMFMAQLQAMGYSKENAAAIAANVHAESGFNPTAKEIGGGQGYGLAQWGTARQAEFKKVMGVSMQSGTPAQQWARQIAFMNYELHHQYRSTLDDMNKAKTAYEKSFLFTTGYERPANMAFQASTRGKLAQQYASDPTVRMAGVSVPLVTSAQSSPVRHHVTNNVNNTHTAQVDQIVVQTNSQDPTEHGRKVADAINRYAGLTFPLNSAVI